MSDSKGRLVRRDVIQVPRPGSGDVDSTTYGMEDEVVLEWWEDIPPTQEKEQRNERI